jgi:cytoskeleton protein RodZ
MSEPGQRAETTGAEVETLQRPGLVLARTREQAGLTQQQLAVALNVSPEMIQALDDDDYSTLGAPVFARGHLRRYAEHLKIDPTPLLEAYAQIADLTEPRVVVPERAGETVHSPVGRQVGLVIVLMVAIGSAGIWFKTVYQSVGGDAPVSIPTSVTARPSPPQVQTTGVAADAASIGDEASTQPEDQSQAVLAGDDQTGETRSSTEEADANLTDTDSRPDLQQANPVAATDSGVVIGPDVRLQVEFVSDAWLEVTDANDEVIYYNLGRTGETLDLGGTAPLRVFVGDAAAVSMRSEGFVIDPTTFQRADRTSRFTLDVNGMVRRR